VAESGCEGEKTGRGYGAITLLAIFAALLFLYSLVSARLERTVLTAPMVFTAAGMAVFLLLRQVPSWSGDRQFFLRVAEVGLLLLLFTDSSRTDLHVLRDISNLPARLLSAGMLLTIFLGALVALAVFRQLSIWEAGILAAILAPTDAGLGQVIVGSPHVPMRIRQALNVEAGLNDGLAVPFLFFFIALAGTESAAQEANLARLLLEQLGYGVVIGAGIGLIGGWLLGVARRREWIGEPFLELGVVMLPLLCGLMSEAAEASMFIAAFVAGLAVQVGFENAGKHSVEFAEGWGQMFNLSVFFLLGLVVARACPGFTLSHLVYGLLSLTVVRMLPVAIALAGTGLSRASVLFMGWFGPRGLASIVLGVVYLERAPYLAGTDTVRLTVMLTVLVSVFVHGLSAIPGIDLYAHKVASLDATAPEHDDATAQPTTVDSRRIVQSPR
jgi:NhaP-type Na+/H+ or K+/H+ antiporter